MDSNPNGCDLVEMYFDPYGKESVVDCLLKEGRHVACAGEWNGDCAALGGLEPDKDGAGMELHNWNENMETADSLSVRVLPRKRARSLMSMVTSALRQLEVTDS